MEIRWGFNREQTTVITKPKQWFVDQTRKMNSSMPKPIVLVSDIPPCLGALLDLLTKGTLNVLKSYLQTAIASSDAEVAAVNAMIFYYEKLLLVPNTVELNVLEALETAAYSPYADFLNQFYAAIGHVNIYGRKVLTADGYQNLINDCLPANLVFTQLDRNTTKLQGLINQYRLDNTALQDIIDLLEAVLNWLVSYKSFTNRVIDAVTLKAV